MSPFRMAILGLGLSLPLAALAQTNAPSAAPHADAARRERASMTPQQRAQRMETHLTELRAQLAITPAQQAPWEAYAEVSRANATELHNRFQQREAQFARINAAENMADYATIAELRATQLRRISTVFQTLYATLSAEQQQSADKAFRARQTPGAAPG